MRNSVYSKPDIFGITFLSDRRFSEWICRLCWPSFAVFLTAAGSRSDSRHGKLHVALRWAQPATEAESQTVSWLERERENEGLCKDVLCSLRPKRRNGVELKERKLRGGLWKGVEKERVRVHTMHIMTVFCPTFSRSSATKMTAG